MILAIDIGGTNVKMGLVDHNGKIHAFSEAAANFDEYKTPILSTVLRQSKLFIKRAQARIEGIAVSATGQIDTCTGTVIGGNGSIPNYIGSQIKKTLEDEFSINAWVLNDANAAVLGECFAGRARGLQNVLMLTLGTGVGGGLVLNGEIYKGSRGIAGELGHFSLYQDGPHCTCGKRGCLEQYASTSALVRRAQQITGDNTLTSRAIFALAESGDTVFIKILHEWIVDIAAGITGLVHIFNPEMVLIGGGVSAQEELLIQPLRKHVLAGVMPCFAEGLSVERATLGNDAGMIGAVKFYLDNQ